MVNSRPESGEAGASDVVVVRRSRIRRYILWAVAGLLAVLIAALVIVWIERRTIAGNVIDNELDKRGVRATYTLDRVGLRTQQISNLVVGDPKNPDVVAKRVLIQMRLKLDGSADVYRIVARGLRLRGTVAPSGRVSWGELDKLLPPPSGKPFTLPDVAVDIADSSISLRTPWGPLGFAIAGAGNLAGGFKGRYVTSSPHLVTGRCFAHLVRGSGAVGDHRPAAARRRAAERRQLHLPDQPLFGAAAEAGDRQPLQRGVRRVRRQGADHDATADRRRQRAGRDERHDHLHRQPGKGARPDQPDRAEFADGHHRRRPHAGDRQVSSSAPAPAHW